MANENHNVIGFRVLIYSLYFKCCFNLREIYAAQLLLWVEKYVSFALQYDYNVQSP